MTEAASAPARPSTSIIWLARVLCWLCWFGIFGAIIATVAASFDLFPKFWEVRRVEGESDLISSSITVNDPTQPGATDQLYHDPIYLLADLVPLALFVWALWSARQVFVGVGHGDYFGRRTVLNLRNFALAVLLRMTVAPLVLLGARAIYLSRFPHGNISLSFSLNGSILLTLAFVGAVAILSTVMAHAARIEDENRQFI